MKAEDVAEVRAIVEGALRDVPGIVFGECGFCGGWVRPTRTQVGYGFAFYVMRPKCSACGAEAEMIAKMTDRRKEPRKGDK